MKSGDLYDFRAVNVKMPINTQMCGNIDELASNCEFIELFTH